MIECPCRYCTKRNETCHGNCEEYKVYCDENEIMRQKIYNKKRNAFLDYTTRKKKRR